MWNRLKGEVSERDYMQMNTRLYLNLGLVCDLQSQDSAAIHFFKKVFSACNVENNASKQSFFFVDNLFGWQVPAQRRSSQVSLFVSTVLSTQKELWSS